MKCLVRFWLIDEDTMSEKDGSPWFDVDDYESIDNWFDKFPKYRRFVEEHKYVHDET